MQKKIVTLTIFVVVSVLLCSCKGKELTGNTLDNSVKTETEDSTNETVIVEDEVTVDFGTQEQKSSQTTVEKDADMKDENLSGDQSQEKEDSHVGTNDAEKLENEEKPKDNEEQIENPYDKDGDGFVDGWY